MAKMPKDSALKSMQIFTPERVQAVTISTPWEPGSDDRVFLATEDVNVTINAYTEVALPAYTPLGIMPGFTYTFDASISLLVM